MNGEKLDKQIEARLAAKKLASTPQDGRIVKIKDAQTGLDISEHDGGVSKYILDNGYSWSDTSGRYKVGDKVVVEPFMMGTVKVRKA